MQVVEYLRRGVYAKSKKELLPMLSGNEAELLCLGMDAAHYEERTQSDPDALFRLLLEWTGSTLRELAR